MTSYGGWGSMISGGIMHRIGALVGALVLLATCVVVLAQAVPERADATGPTLPSGFTLVDTPTGQAALNLTDYSWLPDGSDSRWFEATVYVGGAPPHGVIVAVA